MNQTWTQKESPFEIRHVYTHRPDYLKWAISFLLIVSALLFFGWLIEKSLQKMEINECHLWEKQAKVYPAYYLNQWQQEQCKHYAINIDLRGVY